MFPRKPDFATNTLDFTIANGLDLTLGDWVAQDVIKTMLIYSRRELTEDTDIEQGKVRPVKNHKIIKQQPEFDIDIDAELEKEGLILL